MGINNESDTAANLVIGPTSHGMVRIFVEAEGIELPMDFHPDEALEIAEELRASAQRARSMGGKTGARDAGKGGKAPPKGGDAGRKGSGRRP